MAALLSVAVFETRAGDAWPGEHNWGGTTRRALHPDERAVLLAAGIVPTVGPAHIAIEAQARMALAAAASAGTIADPGPGCALHCDSTPNGPYFVFFAAFPTDEEGAAYFAGFFKTAAEKAAVAAANVDALARAMYAAKYYTGISKDPETDIETYAGAIERIFPGVASALADWTPGADPPPLEVGSVEWVQQRLNALGISTPPLAEDGDMGPKTSAALRAYQISNGLAVTGAIDSETVNSLTS